MIIKAEHLLGLNDPPKMVHRSTEAGGDYEENKDDLIMNQPLFPTKK